MKEESRESVRRIRRGVSECMRVSWKCWRYMMEKGHAYEGVEGIRWRMGGV